MLMMAVALFAGFALALDGFTAPANLLNIVRSVSVLGILAAGMGIVVIGRGIDLSMVSIMVVTVAIQLQLLQAGWSLWSASAVVAAITLALGFMNGFMVAYAGVSALFATLASSAFVFGFVRSRILGLPVDVVVFLAVVAVALVLLRWSRPGRFLYLMGDNFQAARTMGIPVRPLIVASFMASALLAWLAGVASAVSLQSMNTRLVNSALLYDVVLVVVIGGIGLSGGKGGMRNVVVGALLIGILLNGMTILNLPNIHQNLIKALILLGAIILDGQLNPRDEQTSQQGDI